MPVSPLPNLLISQPCTIIPRQHFIQCPFDTSKSSWNTMSQTANPKPKPSTLNCFPFCSPPNVFLTWNPTSCKGQTNAVWNIMVDQSRLCCTPKLTSQLYDVLLDVLLDVLVLSSLQFRQSRNFMSVPVNPPALPCSVASTLNFQIWNPYTLTLRLWSLNAERQH